MATISMSNQSTKTFSESHLAPVRRAASEGQVWALRRMQQGDVPAVKSMFQKLHTFNSALDHRFTLSQHWEPHFYAAMQKALGGNEAVGIIAYKTQTGKPCGFALAAIHDDSNMWRYHAWVEVEALYVEDTFRGSGLAELLLDSACEWAHSNGQDVIQLYVTASNERAIRFYQHEGFRETQAIMRKELF